MCARACVYIIIQIIHYRREILFCNVFRKAIKIVACVCVHGYCCDYIMYKSMVMVISNETTSFFLTLLLSLSVVRSPIYTRRLLYICITYTHVYNTLAFYIGAKSPHLPYLLTAIYVHQYIAYAFF
jgi:hypothetical protein